MGGRVREQVICTVDRHGCLTAPGKKIQSGTHVMDTWAATCGSHTQADLWTASTWRPPNPPNPASPFLPFATDHPHLRDPAPAPARRRSPIRFLPSASRAATAAAAASPTFPPSLRPAAAGESRRGSSPFDVIRAPPLTTFLGLPAPFASDEQIGSSASSPASSGACLRCRGRGRPRCGVRRDRYASCAPAVSRSVLMESVRI
jgi:hypothetical protein